MTELLPPRPAPNREASHADDTDTRARHTCRTAAARQPAHQPRLRPALGRPGRLGARRRHLRHHARPLGHDGSRPRPALGAARREDAVAPLGGVLAERLDRRRAMLAMDAARTLLIAAL